MTARPDDDSDVLHILVDERGSALLVSVRGAASADVAEQLTRSLLEAARRRPKILAVDLSGLSFVSSTGLGGLVAAHASCRKNGTVFALVRPAPLVQELLEITRLNTLLPVVDSFEEALQIAGQRP